MTVSSTTNRAQFNCNGSTTSFPFTFKYLADSDLQVYLHNTVTGATTLLTLNVDYEITPAIPGPGGTLDFLGTYLATPPGSDYVLTILRFILRTQEVDFRNGDALDEENIEGMGDKLTMMVQELDNKMARTLAFPPTSGISNISVPDPVAGAFLRWNLSGNGLENATYVDPTLITISDYWRAVIDGGDTLPEALTAMGLDPSLVTLTLPDNVTISDFIKTLLDDNDAAAARATLQIPAASESVAVATQAETDAGALDTKIVTPAKLYATPGVYRKNAVINGDMMVWQRGTTFTASADGAFHADRWSHIATTDAVVTVSKSTNVPTDAQGIGRFAASLQVDVTTADTSIGSGQAHAIRYKVEGYDIRGLVGQVCTLSFWVYATKTGIYCVNLLCSGADHSYVKEYTINSANTWEKKTITFTLDASSGTWDFTNGVGLQIRWTLAAGSNYQTATDGVWGTALYATANQVNGLDSSDNYFLLTGVQLEKGSAATPFEYRHFAEEFALCQRYFEKSYGQSTTPGTATNVGRIFFTSAIANDYGYCSFKVTKRAAATVVFYSPTNGASGYCRDYSSAVNVALSGDTINEFGVSFSGTLTTAHLFAVHYTASAEL